MEPPVIEQAGTYIVDMQGHGPGRGLAITATDGLEDLQMFLAARLQPGRQAVMVEHGGAPAQPGNGFSQQPVSAGRGDAGVELSVQGLVVGGGRGGVGHWNGLPIACNRSAGETNCYKNVDKRNNNDKRSEFLAAGAAVF